MDQGKSAASGSLLAMSVTNTSSTPELLPEHVRAPGLHAGFWMRVAAYMLDYLILLAATFVLGLVVAVLKSMGASSEVSVPGWHLLNLGIAWLYFAAFESSSWQATPGKRALGLRVVDMHGARIGFGRATGRFLGKIISTLILAIGYMMAGWTAHKQTLHDMMAGCCVVRQGGLNALAENRLPGYRASMPAWAVVLIICGVLVVLVIPVLAAIAIPAYQDYVARTQVSTGMLNSAETRSAVIEYLRREGQLPPDMASLGSVAMAPGKYVRTVQVDNGKVVLTFGGSQVNDSLRGRHLTFYPPANGAAAGWTCRSEDIPDKRLPRRCRP